MVRAFYIVSEDLEVALVLTKANGVFLKVRADLILASLNRSVCRDFGASVS